MSFFHSGHIGPVTNQNKKGIIKRSKNEKRIMNTNIWNNIIVSSETGYTIEMLKSCLYNLSKFIEEYLEPNKLKYFDVESIKLIENCPIKEINVSQD